MENQHHELKQLFEEVMEQLLQQLSSLSGEQLNHRYISEKWTPGQLGLHLYKSYASLNTMRGNTIPADRPIDEKLPQIKAVFLNVEKLYDSPPEIVPADEPVQKKELLDGLRQRIKEQRAVWEREDLSRICTDFAIPGYGPFTRLEWLGLNTYHTLRHVEQLKAQLTLM